MLKHMPEHRERNLFWKQFLAKNVGLFTYHEKFEKKGSSSRKKARNWRMPGHSRDQQAMKMTIIYGMQINDKRKQPKYINNFLAHFRTNIEGMREKKSL